jgi:hypothetical protein
MKLSFMAVSHENVLVVVDFHLSCLKPWLHEGVIMHVKTRFSKSICTFGNDAHRNEFDQFGTQHSLS